MRIAIYFGHVGFKNVDISNPQLGNPGIGGTEYEFFLLAYALAKFTDVTVDFYHHEPSNKLAEGVNSIVVHDYDELFEMLESRHSDILIFCQINENIQEQIKSRNINSISWIHTHLKSEEYDSLNDNPSVKRVVFVSREHYDCFIDHPVISKSTFIYNMFDGRHLKLREFPEEPAVTFTGGLYRLKHFHILASMWPDILREVPNAKLYVVGSGRLYCHDTKLGSLGVASSDYEAMFAKYLAPDGKILPSVKFCGSMGLEKSDIYYKTTVGVMNPGGGETFGISALDMEACGVPIVTKANGGLLNTAKHQETGLLGKNEREIKRYIIRLLKDRDLNTKLGRQAKRFAESEFLPEKLVKQWVKLFDDILNDKPCEFIKPSENFRSGHKWAKVINRWLMMHHVPTVPVFYMKGRIKLFIKSLMPGPYEFLKKMLKRS